MCVFIVESSKVLYKLLDILKFENIVELSTSILAHKIFNKSSSIPSLFYDSLRAAPNLHKYNTTYPFKGNLFFFFSLILCLLFEINQLIKSVNRDAVTAFVNDQSVVDMDMIWTYDLAVVFEFLIQT